MGHRIALVCAVIASVIVTGAPAAAQISHHGQDISEHVVLRDGLLSGRNEVVCPPSASFKGRSVFRVLPDGTRESAPFTTPSGRYLVITDVEWTVDALASGLSLTAGANVRTRVQIGSGTSFTSVFQSHSVVVGSERGFVSGSDQLTTGFVVGPNTLICPGSNETGANTIRSARLSELVLRGYLISAH